MTRRSGNGGEGIQIRAEAQGDRKAVDAMLRAAFGGDGESRLVERLRKGDDLIVSLVADSAGDVVGHIALSRALVSGDSDLEIAWLAPLAVRPDRQGEGIGSSLVYAGMDVCLGLGLTHAVVVGDPDYYGRFGFSAEEARGLASRFQGSALQLIDMTHAAPPLSGRLSEPDAFMELEPQAG
ncbi:MAG: N-acetyltransferase [Pseudomonadota bacterium]|nr:N-acetyltransferase [Pseudomonadota bacterium]